jgi:phosphatidylglycerophosphate synthase
MVVVVAAAAAATPTSSYFFFFFFMFFFLFSSVCPSHPYHLRVNFVCAQQWQQNKVAFLFFFLSLFFFFYQRNKIFRACTHIFTHFSVSFSLSLSNLSFYVYY